MRSVNTLVVGILLTASSSSMLAQANPAGGAKVAPAAVKTSQQAPKTAAKPKPKSAARKPVETAAASPADAQAPAEGEKLARRDPFESLLNRQKDNGAGKNLPPGKAGLQVSTLRLDGIVRSSNGMIAVVSNPQARTYFLREGDQLYDGRVEKIAMDGVSFHELGKDAFGKPVERQVNKRIYASAGEQQ
jgi:Tfp pilus assembly protein PilP